MHSCFKASLSTIRLSLSGLVMSSPTESTITSYYFLNYRNSDKWVKGTTVPLPSSVGDEGLKSGTGSEKWPSSWAWLGGLWISGTSTRESFPLSSNPSRGQIKPLGAGGTLERSFNFFNLSLLAFLVLAALGSTSWAEPGGWGPDSGVLWGYWQFMLVVVFFDNQKTFQGISNFLHSMGFEWKNKPRLNVELKKKQIADDF